MGIFASSGITNKKPKDNSFLTLSQRNKEGLSSDNIWGNKRAEEAKAAQSKEASKAEGENGSQEGLFAVSKNESCEKCFETDEQGNVSWSDNAFYGDIGLNFSHSSSTNPLKAGSGKSDVNDLKTEYKKLATRDANGNKYKMQELGEQIKQMGGNTDDIDNEVQKTGATNNGSQKTGNGTLSSQPYIAETGSSVVNNTSCDITPSYQGNTSNLMAALKGSPLGDNYQFQPTTINGSVKQSTAEALASSISDTSNTSSSKDIKNALSNAFSPTSLTTQTANAFTGKATENVAGASLGWVGNGLCAAGSFMVDACTSDSPAIKGAKEDVEKAKEKWAESHNNFENTIGKEKDIQSELSKLESEQTSLCKDDKLAQEFQKEDLARKEAEADAKSAGEKAGEAKTKKEEKNNEATEHTNEAKSHTAKQQEYQGKVTTLTAEIDTLTAKIATCKDEQETVKLNTELTKKKQERIEAQRQADAEKAAAEQENNKANAASNEAKNHETEEANSNKEKETKVKTAETAGKKADKYAKLDETQKQKISALNEKIAAKKSELNKFVAKKAKYAQESNEHFQGITHTRTILENIVKREQEAKGNKNKTKEKEEKK